MGRMEHLNTHLQQTMNWNTTDWDTMVWDTTMSTAPTYTTLLNSPCSSDGDEESPNPGKPPSNQTVVGLILDHGGLKHPTMTYTPMDESK